MASHYKLFPILCVVLFTGVTAAIGGVCIAAATVGIIYCRRHRKGMHELS